ncbi:MAG: nitrilotriacetate monooxygenase [Betaproteobacteria bacterium RIFCSPLOWO2_02_FULL_62_17]|nr:MAG: nitrilotriacetate monooxygenase [Betaproteobacteria bacterium RIFCSPLOWO2_02_FULL_62_17]
MADTKFERKPGEKMRLGMFINAEGHHVAGWRHPDSKAGAGQDIAHYVSMARLAERGCFDMLFKADSQSTFGPDDVNIWKRSTSACQLEPITMFAALAMVTSHIGLVSTSSTTYGDPFHVARFFASLDIISGGRAGWNLVTSSAASEAFNFSYDAHVPHAQRYERAAEFVQVVMGLWESWDADAFLGDKEQGLYFDPAKLHFLNHQGKHFKVRGPLTVMRSPQNRPVIVQAGQSEDGRELAAETAEVLFAVQQRIEPAREFYADIKRRLVEKGRRPESLLIMPGVMPVLGRTVQEAEQKFEQLNKLIHPEQGVPVLSDMVGTDLSKYPLDGPLPPKPPINTQQGRQAVVYDLAQRENLSIRQLYQRLTGQRAHRVVCGTAASIADDLEMWFRSGGADGFNLMPLIFPQGLEDIVDQLIPELQRRGLFRTDYEGRTLRANLGLLTPVARKIVVTS